MSVVAQIVKSAQQYRPLGKAVTLVEAAVFGTVMRRSALSSILDAYYRSTFRRKWVWRSGANFTDHTFTFWQLYRGNLKQGIYSLSRGFRAAQLIKEGDNVLDFGCGDGGFTMRFLAPMAGHVLAVDCSADALAAARFFHGAPNITYELGRGDWTPKDTFDVITLDGVIGYLTAQEADILLRKLSSCLKPTGVFSGSYPLGHEGQPQAQIFYSEDEIRASLSPHFSGIVTEVGTYQRCDAPVQRRECYWTARKK